MTTADRRARLQSIFWTTEKKSHLVVYPTERFQTEINNGSIYLARDDWSVDLRVKWSQTTLVHLLLLLHVENAGWLCGTILVKNRSFQRAPFYHVMVVILTKKCHCNHDITLDREEDSWKQLKAPPDRNRSVHPSIHPSIRLFFPVNSLILYLRTKLEPNWWIIKRGRGSGAWIKVEFKLVGRRFFSGQEVFKFVEVSPFEDFKWVKSADTPHPKKEKENRGVLFCLFCRLYA